MPYLKNSNATFWVIFKHCVGDKKKEYVKASKIELLPSVVYCVKLQDIFVCLM